MWVRSLKKRRMEMRQPNPTSSQAPGPASTMRGADKQQSGRDDPLKGLEIRWKDGLPKDETEDVANEVAAVMGGIRSKYTAILHLNDGDAEAADKELERIKQEQQESMLADAAIAGTPPDANLQQSAQVVQQIRQGQGQGQITTDTRTQEEGGKKPSGTPAPGGAKPPPPTK